MFLGSEYLKIFFPIFITVKFNFFLCFSLNPVSGGNIFSKLSQIMIRKNDQCSLSLNVLTVSTVRDATRRALVAEWMWKENLDLSWSDRMRQIGHTKSTTWTVLEVHRQRTELRSTCWLSETKGRLCKWVLLTLWFRSTFLRVFYKWHFGSWLHRRKVKKQNDTKRMAVFYSWWKKEKHSFCLRNSEPVKEDKRPQIEAKNITSITDKGCLATQNIQSFEPNCPVNRTSESGTLTCQI